MGEFRHLYKMLVRTCDSKQPPWNTLTQTGCKGKAGPALHRAPSYERTQGSSSRVAYLTLVLCQFTSEETAQYSLNRKLRCPRIHPDAFKNSEKHQETTPNFSVIQPAA